MAALADGPMEAAFPLGAVLILAGLPVGAVSLLMRFRRARGPQPSSSNTGGRLARR